MKIFISYLKALFKEIFFYLFLGFDCFSILSSYDIIPYKIPRTILIITPLLAFFLANFRIYKKLSNTVNEKSVKTDEKNLAYIVDLFSRNEMFDLLEQLDFGGPFERKRLEGLNEFVYNFRKPQYKFTSRKVEGLRKNLFEKAKHLLYLIGQNTFPEQYPNQDQNRVPKELNVTDLNHWREIVDQLNEGAQDVINAYEKLIDTARQV